MSFFLVLDRCTIIYKYPLGLKLIKLHITSSYTVTGNQFQNSPQKVITVTFMCTLVLGHTTQHLFLKHTWVISSLHCDSKVEKFQHCNRVESVFFKEAWVSSSEDLNGMRQKQQRCLWNSAEQLWLQLPFRMSHSTVIHLLLSLRAFCHLLTVSSNNTNDQISLSHACRVQLCTLCVICDLNTF